MTLSVERIVISRGWPRVFRWGLAAVALSLSAWGADTAPEPTAEQTLAVGEPLRTLVVPLSEPVLDAMRLQRWDQALQLLRAMDQDSLIGPQKADWAFLVGWSATHGTDPGVAGDVLPLLDAVNNVPPSYLALVRGEILLGQGKPLEALPWLDKVDTSSVIAPRAALKAADALAALERTDEARKRLQPMVDRPDPSAGNAEVLLRLAEWQGLGSETSAPLLRRITTYYPGTEPDRLLAQKLSTPVQLTWQERAVRAENWLDAGNWDRALTEITPIATNTSGDSLDACRLRFVYGRALYKKNAVSDAADVLAGIGKQCATASVDYGPRGLYLLGTALYRRKQFDASAAAYRELADLFPNHSMADDALTRGGISLLEAGKPAEARKWWEEGLAEHPEGDTVPEALLRLAFSRYVDGDTADARAIAAKLGALPLDGDATSVQAGRYWAARWRLYGTASAPSQPSTDKAARADAVSGWKALCEQLPHSFYAILAYSRLVEVAPDVAAALAKRPATHQDGSATKPWIVRLALAKDPHMRDGVALMRLGLSGEALSEWRRTDLGSLSPDERAWLSELRIASGDWVFAHDELRRWILSHPLTTLGEREPQLQRLAYPDRYWREVQSSVKADYHYEPRLFHALVREESNFNREIISFAGARGLSQLMPATARQTAGWLGITIDMEELSIPERNLPIGARYLEAMHHQLADSPFLALAAYNGGATNVNKWVTDGNNPPTDEWVERIPFEETRGYVKRVMGTWQTMRHRFDLEDAAFPDLSRYNHHAKPGAQ